MVTPAAEDGEDVGVDEEPGDEDDDVRPEHVGLGHHLTGGEGDGLELVEGELEVPVAVGDVGVDVEVEPVVGVERLSLNPVLAESGDQPVMDVTD
jgi:hypothetical protein